MSDKKPNKYSVVISNMLKTKSSLLVPGKTVIAIWRNEAHFEKWRSLCNKSGAMLLIRLPTEQLDQIKTTKDTALVAGVGFGISGDFSDLRLVYYMEVVRNFKE